MNDTTKTPDPITDETTFENALRAVFAHSSKDRTLPILTGVNMVGGRLYGTDRYTLGIARFLPKVVHATEEAWLSPQLIRLILSHNGDPMTSLEASVDRIKVTFESGIVHEVPIGGALDIQVQKFPPVQKLGDNWHPAESGQLSFNGEFTKKFSNTHIKGDTHAPLTFEPGKASDSERSNGMFRVRRVGLNWFVGYVVEIRVS